MYLKKRPCWEDDLVKELVEEGWTAVKQETTDGGVENIPQIFKDCLQLAQWLGIREHLLLSNLEPFWPVPGHAL